MIGRIMHLKSQQRHKEYIQEVAPQIKRLDVETLAASSNEVNQSKLKHLKNLIPVLSVQNMKHIIKSKS